MIDVVGLKVGGSVATKKDDEKFPLDLKKIKDVSTTSAYMFGGNIGRIGKYEILPVISNVMVFLGFGVGPFGHNLVNKSVASKTVHESCSFYCERVRDILKGVGLPVVYEERYSPYRLCKYSNGNLMVEELADWSFDVITNEGIPLMHGDMVEIVEGRGGYLNGNTDVATADLIIPKVAIDLKKMFANDCKVRRIVAATDVDGLYKKDPRLHKGAIFIEKIGAYDDLENMQTEKRGTDVTGRVPGKVRNYQLAAQEGIEGIIVNGLVENRIKNALLGKNVRGTLILP